MRLFCGLILVLVSGLTIRGAENQLLSTTLSLQEATKIVFDDPEALSKAVDYCDNKIQNENGGFNEEMDDEVIMKDNCFVGDTRTRSFWSGSMKFSFTSLVHKGSVFTGSCVYASWHGR